MYKLPNGYTSIHLGDIFVLISVYINNSKSDDSAYPADIGGWCETYSLINLNYLSYISNVSPKIGLNGFLCLSILPAYALTPKPIT